MEIDPNHLPDDLATVQQMVLALLARDQERERLLKQMQHQLEQLLRWRYGARRERVDENQLFLFAAEILRAGASLDAAAGKPAGEAAAAEPEPSSRPSGHGRQRLPKSLERRRVVHELAEDQRRCPECQGELQRIGEETSERLEYLPASLHVIQDVCGKYACAKGCTVVTAPKPEGPIAKGLPGPGLLAHVAVSKYGDHLPLNRQQEIFERQGVELSRQTMCGWMRQAAELVAPLWERMKRQVLDSKVVQTDDTPVPVLDQEMPHTRTGRIWTYVGDAAHPYTVYDYTADRSRDGPDEFLHAYHGYLQADAYSGYDGLYKQPGRGIVEVACWAHARRKFYEAQSSDLMRATVMLAYAGLLYEVEREAHQRGLRGEARLALRRQRSKPILEDVHTYLVSQRNEVLPKSPIGEAISYALGNWTALLRYCEDGDLEIDNNGAERSLRPIAVGRKNWMFYGSDNGGRTAAVLSTLIATCKRLSIDPFAYLRDIFERIGAHPTTRLNQLLPDQWAATQPARSS
jgi:transposase